MRISSIKGVLVVNINTDRFRIGLLTGDATLDRDGGDEEKESGLGMPTEDAQ